MSWLMWAVPLAGMVLNLLVFTWIGGRFTARIEGVTREQATLIALHEKRLDGHDDQLDELSARLASARR